jgi:membrane-associated phospholipid phosphatase
MVEFTRKLLRPLELSDFFILAYWLIVAALQVVAAPRIISKQGTSGLLFLLVVDLMMVATVIMVARNLADAPTGRRLTGKSIPIFLTFYLGFLMLPFYAMAVHPHSYEAELLWFDQAVFGMPVAMFLEPYLVKGVTDFAQLCYASHYLLPFILMGLMLKDGKAKEAEWLAAAVSFVVLTGFLLYIVVPARSPYVLAHAMEDGPIRFAGPVPMTGWGMAIRDWLHQNETFKYDCFPSGHTQLSLTVLVASWRYHRRSFPAFLIVVSGLIFATLYLQYHYVIDLAAGAALAWFGWKYVPRWVHLISKRGETHAGSKAAVDFSKEQAGDAG